jgi:C-terminal processing protease CtpA/Prc
VKVALVDGRTLDYAESLAAYFPAQRTGPLLGEATAGANGNAARAKLPSGMVFYFTSMRITRHDGTSYHREGLKPDEPATPTLAGIAAGRDELLDRALLLIEKTPQR